MDIFATYAVDEVAEQDGAEVRIGDATFKIARAGNKRYVKLLTELVEKHGKELDLRDDNADKVSDRIMIEVLAKTVLLGWDDKVEYKGEKLPYSVENAKELLSHREFRKAVMQHSDDYAHFKAKLEEEAKN